MKNKKAGRCSILLESNSKGKITEGKLFKIYLKQCVKKKEKYEFEFKIMKIHF